MPPLILASASPRRHELIRLLGVSATIVVSRFDESSLFAAQGNDPEGYVRAAALGKAQEVAGRCDGFILGVDTDVVAPDGALLGKPTDPDDARRMLQRLAGRTHRVLSGLALLHADTAQGGIIATDVRLVETRVTFAPLSDTAIDAYVATGEPLDKAGGYGIQGGALPFVCRIDGDPSNVIGLPLWTLAEMLTARGITLWNLPAR